MLNRRFLGHWCRYLSKSCVSSLYHLNFNFQGSLALSSDKQICVLDDFPTCAMARVSSYRLTI